MEPTKEVASWLKDWKLELYIPNVVGKREREEKRLLQEEQKVSLEKTNGLLGQQREDKKVSVMLVCTGEWSFHLLQGFMIGSFLFFLLDVNLPLGGNLWQTHVPGVADFRRVREFREVFFLLLLNLTYLQLKIIFIPTLGFPGGFHWNKWKTLLKYKLRHI